MWFTVFTLNDTAGGGGLLISQLLAMEGGDNSCNAASEVREVFINTSSDNSGSD